MTRFLASIGVAILALFAIAGCNDYGNTFQSNTGALLQFISPSTANAGAAALTITLTGSGFVAQTYATLNEKKIVTTVTTDPSTGDVISITAVIPAANLTTPGTLFVQTVNPHSGAGYNGLSNTVTFTVNPAANPAPTITSISPTSVAACGTNCATTAFTLTINGSNFLPSSSTTGVSQVNWNMGPSQTTFTTANTSSTNLTISSSSIQLTLTSAQAASLLANPATAVVTVSNPPLTQTCPAGVSCGGNGGGGTSPCPLVAGSTTVTVCTLTVTDPSNTNTNSASLEEETPAISSDGRYVAYTASQSGHYQVLARDTCQGTDSSCEQKTVLVSSTLDGSAGGDDSHAPSMSSNGRYVAFSSAANNLTSDSVGLSGRQVYLRDTCLGVSSSCTPSTQLISTDPTGHLVGTEAILPSVSGSGRFIAFLAVTPSQSRSASAAASVKSGSSSFNSGLRQMFVRDTCLGAQNCTPSTSRIAMQPGDGTNSNAKPAGPAMSSGSSNLALAGGNTATILTHSLAVDDGVFVALTKTQQ